MKSTSILLLLILTISCGAVEAAVPVIQEDNAGVYIFVLDANAYELTNDTGVEVDSYRFKVKFYDANDNLLESEIFSGDNFGNGGTLTTISVCSITPANCAYIKADLRATLIDSRVFRDAVQTEDDC